MSKSLFNSTALRFWDEAEIDFREYATKVLSRTVKETLLAINPSFSFSRLEAPCLAPANTVSNAYDENDIFITNHMHSNQFFVLRPETTYSSYLWAKSLQKKLPLCVWQMAKSFRRETNDGATASKMRFNEFYQLEFQCIYSRTTKADYRASLIENVSKQLQKLCNKEIRIIETV